MYVMDVNIFNLRTKGKNIEHCGWISESSVYSAV